MPNRLFIDSEHYTRIVDHLLQGMKEQVAFIFANAHHGKAEVVFETEDIYLVPPEGLEYNSDRFVSLTDATLAHVIKSAWDRQVTLAELHSHPDPRYAAAFSPSDLYGLKEVVPHVWWRLRGQPYLAIVVGPNNFDALVWRTDPSTPEQLDSVVVDGVAQRPTGITFNQLQQNGGYGTF